VAARVITIPLARFSERRLESHQDFKLFSYACRKQQFVISIEKSQETDEQNQKKRIVSNDEVE